MKVALIAESFLPHMNGVTQSLLQVLVHLERSGHEALVIAPRARGEAALPDSIHGARVVPVPAVPFPGYGDVRVARPGVRRLVGLLDAFGPDVVHLASPFVLGWQGVLAAEAIGVPSVAVYQTDVPGYAARYGLAAAEPALTAHLARLHRRATLSLAPSASALARLAGLGVDRLRPWARGVDAERFRPDRRSAAWRREVAPGGEVVVGYVGRLASEKQVEDLRVLDGLPGIRLVVVGAGPERAALEAVLPGAHFTGFLGGDALAEALASFDVFVHPGEHETFGQTIQEAHASGVPVVATGRGGPLDLVRSSRTGWLYRPGDLDDLRDRVLDLAGDEAKRRAFGVAARAAVEGRTWSRLGDELAGHYRDAMRMHRAGAPAVTAHAHGRRRAVAPEPGPEPAAVPPVPAPAPPRRRYVALGDSLTEGLCDRSRAGAGAGDGADSGAYRGWADRLAMLLDLADGDVHYANLAVRSRKVDDVLDRQVPRALALGADLVTVLVGANDLVRVGADARGLADRLGGGIAALRAADCEVLVVGAFMPPSPRLRGMRRRFATFNARLGRHAAAHGAHFVDVGADAEVTGPRCWAEDRVHLNAAGHRALAYRAAEALGVPDAAALAGLDAALHAAPEASGPLPTRVWLRRHAVPWMLRRLRGRAAGDGRAAKHEHLVPVATAPGDPGMRARAER
ncbi:GDSL-type esterase/lipase family protein [Agromyces sp. MMS24-JH15]|uniref:GDSL-type esterase/lipase family protein n=1 Tax=Agromyces sp. MMS24-JH15 TaxID=3243765 RepID=UPI00374A7A5D